MHISSIQMVSLYRNPTGEGIFTGHTENTLAKGLSSQLGMTAGDEVEALKKRVKELEESIRLVLSRYENENITVEPLNKGYLGTSHFVLI